MLISTQTINLNIKVLCSLAERSRRNVRAMECSRENVRERMFAREGPPYIAKAEVYSQQLKAVHHVWEGKDALGESLMRSLRRDRDPSPKYFN